MFDKDKVLWRFAAGLPDFIEILLLISEIRHTDKPTWPSHRAFILYTLCKECVTVSCRLNMINYAIHTVIFPNWSRRWIWELGELPDVLAHATSDRRINQPLNVIYNVLNCRPALTRGEGTRYNWLFTSGGVLKSYTYISFACSLWPAFVNLTCGIKIYTLWNAVCYLFNYKSGSAAHLHHKHNTCKQRNAIKTTRERSCDWLVCWYEHRPVKDSFRISHSTPLFFSRSVSCSHALFAQVQNSLSPRICQI